MRAPVNFGNASPDNLEVAIHVQRDIIIMNA